MRRDYCPRGERSERLAWKSNRRQREENEVMEAGPEEKRPPAWARGHRRGDAGRRAERGGGLGGNLGRAG